ncbi:HK97-gp10 family putative phage morphogenesis protein [Pantoea sp. GM01]|uniref:HK97-gp10 family putative phage morphogenesis protein n=1 Tax=Pantoea sp. GM01 TaxID=1144320 RepID=UPI000270FFC6|nr:HK97-gp10 family putative phage morphogenesis protein [Pantoea sp. GM01]EJL90219.1 phage protein, HK97 gp10 family [Pantoea sp. GM01]
MITTNLDFSGLADLTRDLELLSKAENRQVLRQSVRAGAEVLADEVENNAPEQTGKLKRNIVVLFGKGAQGTAVAGVHIRGVNPRTGNSDTKTKANSPNNAFYWRFIEQGTSKMPARPFVRPAYDSKQEEATAAAFAEMLKAIDGVLSK